MEGLGGALHTCVAGIDRGPSVLKHKYHHHLSHEGPRGGFRGSRQLSPFGGEQVMVVVDFHKGYNSVSFSFLRTTLTYTGLSPAHVGVLMSVMVGPVLFCVGRGFDPDVVLCGV